VLDSWGNTVTAEHLGGYVPGGDPATRYPELWDWFVREHGVRSVLDVGCGDGVAVDHFAALGCRVRGIDGVPQDHPLIVEHDYANGPYVPSGSWDLAWSCEFVEHVAEEHAPNYLATFRAAKLVLMTHADPGQQGWHHVNCRPASYWIRLFAGTGFVLDDGLTLTTRELACANPSPLNHYARSGLVFVQP